MSTHNTKSMKNTKDFFGDDFEVIYQEDYSDIPRDNYKEDTQYDDYEDVLSTLSELDKGNKAPNPPSPAARILKTGRRAIIRLINILLRRRPWS